MKLSKNLKDELFKRTYFNQGAISIEEYNELRRIYKKPLLSDFNVRQAQSKTLTLLNLDGKIMEPRLRGLCRIYRENSPDIEEKQEKALKAMEELLFSPGISESSLIDVLREEMVISRGIPTMKHYKHLCSVNDKEWNGEQEQYYRDVSYLIAELDFTLPTDKILAAYSKIARRIYPKASKYKAEAIRLESERKRLMERDKPRDRKRRPNTIKLPKLSSGQSFKLTIELEAR